MKSITSEFWNNRAVSSMSTNAVNTSDVQQRDLENEILCEWLKPSMSVLEVGCGNGYSTSVFRQHVKAIDSFDYSPNMIEQAKKTFGETNNRFFTDNLLNIAHAKDYYDAIICSRVLINLASLEEQITAISNLAQKLQKGGMLFLTEGYRDGFEQINALREQLGIEPIVPSPVLHYSSYEELSQCKGKYFKTISTNHIGCYDFLTRVLYPMLCDSANVSHNTSFHDKAFALTKAYNPMEFFKFSRIRIDVLERM